MNQKDPIGNIIISLLFILLFIAGFISYQSIDWNILKKMEQIPLVLPTPILTNTISPVSTQSAITSPTKSSPTPSK